MNLDIKNIDFETINNYKSEKNFNNTNQYRLPYLKST